MANLISGQDFPPERYNSEAKGIPYIIGASNIESGHLVITRWTDSPSVLSDIGDILVVCKGAGVGKIGINSIGTVHIARQIQAVRIVVEVVLPEYMQMLINWCVPSIVSHANGLIPGLKRELLLGVQLPIPPINEQKRILRILQSVFSILDEIEDHQKKLIRVADSAKKIILDLAIHGKLVPQDSSDEPAIELLKRINPDFVPSHNLHYEGPIPSGWQVCYLCDIFDVTMGQSPDGNSLNKTDGIEFHQGKISFTEKYLSESEVFTSAPTKYATSYSLLCCVRAPVGVFNITPRTVCIGRGLCALTPRMDGVELDYWFYALSRYREYYEGKSTGTTFKAISGDTIRNTIVLLPPIREQKRIINKITELFTLLDRISYSINSSE